MTDKKVSSQELIDLKTVVDVFLVLGINMNMEYIDFLNEIKFPKTELILKDLFSKLFQLIKKKNINKKFSFESQILNLYHIHLNKGGTELDDISSKKPLMDKVLVVLDLFELILEKVVKNKLYLFDVYQFYNLLNEFYEDYDVEILKENKSKSIFSKTKSNKSHRIIKNKDKIQNSKEETTGKKVKFQLNNDDNKNPPTLKDIWKDWDFNNINDDNKKENIKSTIPIKKFKPKKIEEKKENQKTELQKLIEEINKDLDKNKTSKNKNLEKLNKTNTKDDLSLQSKMLLDDDALLDEYARNYQELVLYKDYFLKDYKNVKIEFIDKTMSFLVTAAKLIDCSEEELKNRPVSDVNDVSIKQEESWNTILNSPITERNDKLKTILIYIIEKYLKVDDTLKVDKFLNIFADFKNENALSSCKDTLQILLKYAKELKEFKDEPIFEEKLENIGFYDWEDTIDCIKFVSRMVNLLELLNSSSFIPPNGGKKGGSLL